MTKHFKFRIRISIFHAIPESDPNCTTNATNNKAVAGDYVAYCCEVTYKGRWAPVMEWKNNEDVVQAEVESTGNRSYEVNTVKYTYVTELKPSDNNHVFSCRTYFDQPTLDSGNSVTANNTPTTDNVLSKYRSPNLTVYYGPQLLVVNPVHDSYCPDETIKILADSNPSMRTYEWLNTDTNKTLETSDHSQYLRLCWEVIQSKLLCVIPFQFHHSRQSAKNTI
ncbi:hypothetical protein NP493_4883g00010 [Ridgeia piscesae]|uniref:Ig-like domain-containing protein n=1 Tax=Ridgeia piscesae TaxID=27915 RepID=A0AAD9IY60_RIDPI|nr:hypothetical protein NP493_4883g00010 [Ridgeia piscesae]